MAILEYDADNRTASVSLKTEYGELRYGFTQPDGEYIDIEKLYADAHVHDRELGINAAYVAQALNSICKTTSVYFAGKRQGYCERTTRIAYSHIGVVTRRCI